jgi:hypothetical protein
MDAVMPMVYDENWIPPSRPGQPQARCAGGPCTNNGAHPGKLVVASTLSADGLCAQCSRSPADDEGRELRLGL